MGRADVDQRPVTVSGGYLVAATIGLDYWHSFLALRSWQPAPLGVLLGKLTSRANGVVNAPVLTLGPLQVETWFGGRPVHDKAQRCGLPPLGAVVAIHLDVVLWKCRTACFDLLHNCRAIVQIEQGQLPHLPVRVARMWIVGVLDRNGPAVSEAVLHLRSNLLLREVRQIRKSTLSNSHSSSPRSEERRV